YNLLESDVSKWSYYDDIDASTYLSQNIWPMKNYRITQHRGGIGQAEWAHIYSDKFHHGIDMVSNDSLIYAINDGVAYYYKDQYPGQTIGSGNHVKLFHPDGKMTLYLHMKE
ncbi:hypothetical protein KJ909_01305, partial [Patescibacteria group bacterium]|nr:hypothetical protein [Patescibacteria group bacterium]